MRRTLSCGLSCGLSLLLASCRGGSSSSSSDAKEEPETTGPCAVQLPAARAGQAGAGHVTVAISTEAICVDDDVVAKIIDGAIDPDAVESHFIERLALEADARDAKRRATAAELATPEGPVKPVKVQFDATTRFGSVVDVMFSLGRKEFSTYWYGVEGGTYLPISPPRFDALGGGSRPATKVFVLEDGLRVGGFDGPSIALADGDKPLTDPSRWDLAALDQILGEIEADAGEKTMAIVSAEQTIPFGVLAAVFEVVRGPECPLRRPPEEWTAANCRFPDILVAAGAG